MESIQKSGLESDPLPPGWQPQPPEKRLNPEIIGEIAQSKLSVSSETSLHGGEGTATPTLEVPISYYVIADDAEDFQVGSTDVHVRTLDCIPKVHFWKVLLENLELYQDLTNSYNVLTRNEIENRQKLLDKLLRGEGLKHRLSVLAYTATATDVGPFVPWQWTGARISFKADAEVDGELFEKALKNVPAETLYFITANLLDDLAKVGHVEYDEISEPERALLDEIFSLNHIPDAPLDDGGTTEPAPVPVPPTIVLNEGGFSFEGGGLDFWKEGDCESDDVVIEDDSIELYPRAGKAYCRTTKEEFDVNVGNPDAEESDYSIYLYSPDRCFQISLSGEQLRATAVQPIEWLSTPKEDEKGKEEVIMESSKVQLRSPLKDKGNTVFTTRKPPSPRKPIPGHSCPIDVSNKENLDPQHFHNYPVNASGPKGRPLKLNQDWVFKPISKPTSFASKLHNL